MSMDHSILINLYKISFSNQVFIISLSIATLIIDLESILEQINHIVGITELKSNTTIVDLEFQESIISQVTLSKRMAYYLNTIIKKSMNFGLDYYRMIGEVKIQKIFHQLLYFLLLHQIMLPKSMTQPELAYKLHSIWLIQQNLSKIFKSLLKNNSLKPKQL